MSNYIPIALKLPVKYNIFNLHHQRLQTQVMDYHTQRIQKLCHTPNDPTIERSLFEISKNASQNEALYPVWLMVKPLAHLSSKQLINLYQIHVRSLERSYEYLNAQFPETMKDLLKENIDRLHQLKSYIFAGLRYRAKIYQELNLPKNVDDVIAWMINKINGLKIVDPPLLMPRKISVSLNDDRRLFIFDLLRSTNVDEDTLHDEILSPIPKKGHAPIRAKNDVQHDFDKFFKYREGAIKKLNLQGIGSFIYAAMLTSKREGLKTLWQEFVSNVTDFFKKSSLLEKLSTLKKFIYVAISFVAYYTLIHILEPIALLFLSAANVSMLSGILFYTVAMAPLWWLAFHAVKKGYSLFQDYITCEKKREILDSLVVLEEAEHFMAERLNQIIIDIPHFDIKELNNRFVGLEKSLNKAKLGLHRYARGERFFCGKTMQKSVKHANDKIDSIMTRMKKGLGLLAAHIALRVGEDIELLDKTFDSKKMIPIVPERQLSNLREFVFSVGEGSSKIVFEKNANIIKKWCEKIQSDRFLCEDLSTKGDHQQPWGGWRVKMDGLRGWKILLQAFSRDPIEQSRVLQLNKLLMGKACLSKEQLEDTIHSLNRGESKDIFLEMIQHFLFKTLHARLPEYAALLSPAHKALIGNWYEQNRAEIENINIQVKGLFSYGKLGIAQLNNILSKMTAQELSRYFELLDGEDIYHYSVHKIKSLKERNNLIRQFFEEYEGNTSHAYRLFKFIPIAEQPIWATEFAGKRLSWFLSNVKSFNLQAPFDEYDTALFNNADLHKFGKFDFTEFIINSAIFQEEWSQEMENFLQACQKNGFDSGELLSKYREKKNDSNPFLIKYSGEKRSCQQETIKNVGNLRRVRVDA